MATLQCFVSENADALKFQASDGRVWYGSLSMAQIMFGENFAQELASGLIDAGVEPTTEQDVISVTEEKAAGDWQELTLADNGEIQDDADPVGDGSDAKQ